MAQEPVNPSASAGFGDALALFRRLSSETVASSFQTQNRDVFGNLVYNRSNQTLDNFSTPMGYGAAASGNRSVALGGFATAREDSSVAIGPHTLAGNKRTIAVGDQAKASGFGAIQIGALGLASGNYAIGIGVSTSVPFASIVLGGYGKATAAGQFIVGSSEIPINDIYFGKGVQNTAVNATVTINANGGSGTNVGGGDLRLAGGRGTGNSTGAGAINFATANAGASGTTLQTLTDRWTIRGAGAQVGNLVPANANTYDFGEKDTNMIRDFHYSRRIVAAETTVNPGTGDLDAGDEVAMYRKADKLIFAYNNAGTINYLTIPLDTATTLWTQTAVAP